MAFIKNSSEDVVLAGGNSVCGVATVKMCANGINPTVAQAQEFGIELKQDAGGMSNDKHRLDIYFQVQNKGFEGTIVKMALFTGPESQTYQDQTEQYVDIYGGSAKGLENASKWLKNPYRVAKEGEAILLNLLRNWLNLDPKKDQIDPADVKFDDIVRGNIKSIKELTNPANKDNALDNEFKVLVGIKINDGQDRYMEVFPYAFDRAYTKGNALFTKQLGIFNSWRNNHYVPVGLDLQAFAGVQSTIKPNDTTFDKPALAEEAGF